jgi:hypothetical protein
VGVSEEGVGGWKRCVVEGVAEGEGRGEGRVWREGEPAPAYPHRCPPPPAGITEGHGRYEREYFLGMPLRPRDEGWNGNGVRAAENVSGLTGAKIGAVSYAVGMIGGYEAIRIKSAKMTLGVGSFLSVRGFGWAGRDRRCPAGGRFSIGRACRTSVGLRCHGTQPTKNSQIFAPVHEFVTYNGYIRIKKHFDMG